MFYLKEGRKRSPKGSSDGMHTSATLSDILRLARKLNGISQSDAGAEFGVSERSVRRWEYGTAPHPIFRDRILKTSQRWLVDGIESLRFRSE